MKGSPGSLALTGGLVPDGKPDALPPIRRGVALLVFETLRSIPETLSRNLLLLFITLVTIGGLLQFTLFEISLAVTMLYLTLFVISSFLSED